ncbi:alpha-1,4-N-acetylglucosaminyltransferase-like [Chironomus tepperi]|uniref:alpha-1,4-N-acetylglucosaminyltransferase-like n=1 Tax=Chironomus tepperi TaxID=113505 RepID=UPI00391F8270
MTELITKCIPSNLKYEALMNPNATIFVTFPTPKDHVELDQTNLTEILLQIKNVYFVYQNIKNISKDTPMEDWIKTDELSNSKYIVAHTSDVLRYLLLYKYSGLYLDINVITTYPSAHINLTNFACAESYKWLNGAVIKLTGKSGRKNHMIEVKKNFDGNLWGKNGPELLTRTIKKLCDVSNFSSTKQSLIVNRTKIPKMR